jgi:hypothetical protein
MTGELETSREIAPGTYFNVLYIGKSSKLGAAGPQTEIRTSDFQNRKK